MSHGNEIAHRLNRMTARNPDEPHRTATTLELLYDLALVVAFGVAGSELAHAIAADHIWPGIIAFIFCMFGGIWAWLNYTWFASAYDTDDWLVRLAVLVQMIGVLILALGIPDVFAGLLHGWEFDNGVLVAGYVVMRIPLIALWLRVARDLPEHRRTIHRRVLLIVIAQIGWTAQVFLHLPQLVNILWFVVLYVIEFSAPVVAERSGRTPWHPHHIAERFGLLAIIALGEGIIGTFAAIEADIHEQGWSLDAAMVLFAGVTLTFGMWWVYFLAPMGDVLDVRRSRMAFFSFGQIPVYMAIAAVGAGLHVAAYYVEGHSEIGLLGTILAVVIPTCIFIATIYGGWPLMMKMSYLDPLHIVLILITAAVIGISLAMAAAGVALAWCLAVAALAPWVSVVGFELVGHQHVTQQLEDLRRRV